MSIQLDGVRTLNRYLGSNPSLRNGCRSRTNDFDDANAALVCGAVSDGAHAFGEAPGYYW